MNRTLAMVAILAQALFSGCARNEPPTVSGGPDLRVDAGQNVTLAGEASDIDGAVSAYRWEQLEGVAVSISNADRARARFVAPVVDTVETLQFRLSAIDDSHAETSADVTVTVDPFGSALVSVSGVIQSSDTYAPITGASVTVSQYSDGLSHRVGRTDTDEAGRYTVEASANPGRLTINVEADGFAAQSGVVNVPGETSAVVNLDMVPFQTVRSFAAAEGIDVNVDGQPIVALPANAMVTQDGDAYIGQAAVSIAVLDPSVNPEVMPGDFLSWQADSEAPAPIESYGAVDVALTSEKGEALQLANAGVAEISIPLAAGRDPQEAPATMPLYFWSNEQGFWIEEGTARLEQVSQGRWAYVGSVEHFTTWNADSAYPAISLNGCVTDSNDNPIANAEITASGIDYTGTSSATANAEGRFDIDVRPVSEVDLIAVSGEQSSDAFSIRTGDSDLSLDSCLVVLGDRGLADFPIYIEGETGTIDICVRDHECEDGDAIRVDVEGRNVFSGEIVNDAMCSTLDVEAGRNYEIELTALNGTGYKGMCDFSDANTGEIRISALNMETQVWRHRKGAGSQARIVVTTAVPQPFTIVPTPPDATVRFVAEAERDYQPGMELPPGDYRVEVSAPDYESREVTVAHGTMGPTIFEARLERRFDLGDVFADPLTLGGDGPEMVVIPTGQFRMGCVSGQRCEGDEELPVHDVTIPQSFAVSKYEVTFEDYDRFTYPNGVDDEGWGRGRRPVINVSWDDAQEYVAWLSRQTGQSYRLLSEAEWEYVARAGSSTVYSWGNDLGSNRANCVGCGSQWDDFRTAPVGSFPPNAFGVHDMHGNVREWVEDCWNESYAGAPSDGSAWRSGDYEWRVLRGGSWDDFPRLLRSAFRDWYSTGYRYDIIGFRVARTLTP